VTDWPDAERGLAPPYVRLAHGGTTTGDLALRADRNPPDRPHDRRPSLLVSNVYRRQFERGRADLDVRNWVMDSGAHSAFVSGKGVDNRDYVALCRELLRDDPDLVEVFALDVIGGDRWRETIANTEYAWAEGVPAIPTFHFGEPWEFLDILLRDFPGKIAIGGAAGVRSGALKIRQAEQIFARAWPARIHGFAFGSRPALLRLPFHSVDATTWQTGPCRFGTWRGYSNRGRHVRLEVRGSEQDLRVEVEWHLRLEREARFRWRREFERIEEELPPWPPPRTGHERPNDRTTERKREEEPRP
jgi:hypothetical protein